MQEVIVETTWMLGIIVFMLILAAVAGIGALRKRSRSGSPQSGSEARDVDEKIKTWSQPPPSQGGTRTST